MKRNFATRKNLKLQALAKSGLLIQQNKIFISFRMDGQTNNTTPPRYNGYAAITLAVKPDLVIETGIARGGSIIFLSVS